MLAEYISLQILINLKLANQTNIISFFPLNLIYADFAYK